MHPPLVSVDLWSSLLITVESSCGAPTSVCVCVCVCVGVCGVGGDQHGIIFMRRLHCKVYTCEGTY